MKPVYERLTKEGKIGPQDEFGKPRPFAEYPKWVARSDGKRIICKDQREELAIKAWAGEGVVEDPIKAENISLAQQLAEAQDKLAKYERPVQESGEKKTVAPVAPPTHEPPPVPAPVPPAVQSASTPRVPGNKLQV